MVEGGIVRLDNLLKSIIAISFLVMVTACNGEDKVTKEIAEHLDATVQIEKEFEENQEKIFELEKADEKLYNEIIGLGSDDLAQVQTIAEEAIELLNERMEYVELERTSLEESREKFEKIEPLIEKVTDEEQNEHLEKMYKTMIERYEAYENVYDNYSKSIRLTQELYKLFQQEKFNEKEVYSIIGNVNDSYDNVLEANELFNQQTVLYNDLKEEYYESFQEK